jgi:type IV secretory pathway VirB10-like protein
MWMRVLGAFMLTGCAMAQAPASPSTAATAGQTASATPSASTAPAVSVPTSARLTIPSGTKVPLALKQAISTRNAKEGDPVYCETTFPFVVEDRIVIPAGTYVQGKISRIQRPGRIKGRAELLMHFTSMIYPSGYTVMLPGSLDNIPGADKTSIKGSEGTVRQDSDKGKDIGTVASTASTGAVIGGLSAGGKGAGIGAAAGGLAGLAIAMISRGSDVKLEPGTSIEMIIQREVTVDPSRITSRREVVVRD